MAFDAIFQELRFRNLTVKNRIFRSNIAGRFDNYDGSGNPARINWELKFARGGVGAIISSFVPVNIRGRIVPNYAMIDHDDKIPFWRAVGNAVHEYDCKFIMQLSHSGRQQDIPGIENQYKRALSSTNETESMHGLLAQAMTIDEIEQTVDDFAEGARRAREAGLDGVELHGSHGYLITQFLSSAINDRTDRYGGSLENRARLVREIVQAIRKKVGHDFHLQVKINAVDNDNAVFPWGKKGNTLQESIQVCKWLVEDGVDALHVSTGSSFPHPRSPIGGFPLDHILRTYDTMLSSSLYTERNFKIFLNPVGRRIFKYLWHRTQEPPEQYEGVNAKDAHAVRDSIRTLNPAVPVIVTGGFQTGRKICEVIERGDCDAVSIARPLIANNDLVKYFERGEEVPDNKRCTYCNKCLVNTLKNPLGCYELLRYDGDYDAMIKEIMSVFHPRAFQ